jgi:hypothetical protein
MLLMLLLLASQAPTAADLSFIAGHWKGTMGQSSIIEVWSKPEGDAMVGMFKLTSGGKTRMTEFMAIEQRESGPVLIMRHFNPGLIAREEKDAPLVWTVEKNEPNRAVFFAEKEGSRLEYLRQGDSLTVTLEKTAAGKTTRTPFRFTLAASAP